MNVGVIVIVAVVVLGVAFGVWRHFRDGRVRQVRDVERVTVEQLGSQLGEKATLLQFSSAFCQPCRATHRILEEVTSMVPGVVHIDIDAESHLELVRELDVLRTPTVFILDADGVITQRASGLPRKADVIAAIGNIV